MIGVEQTNPPETRQHRWRRVAAVMVAALLAAEMAARAIEPMVPTTGGWPTAQIAAKVEQMTELAASTDINVVFLGSSSMDQGINPLTFNSRSNGLASYNASLNGLTMRSLELWTLEVVLPTVDPEVVVIGVTTRELNDGAASAQPGLLERLAASRGLDEFSTGDLQLISRAEGLFALLRIRESLRRPLSVVMRLFDQDAGDISGLPGPYGMRTPGERDFSYDFSERWRHEWATKDMRDFEMGGSEYEALKRLVGEVRNQGRQVLLVSLPVSSDYVLVQPGGVTSLEELRHLLSDVAESQNATVLHTSAAFHTRDFRDPAHLNPVAADEFTASVAQELALVAPLAVWDDEHPESP